MNLESTLEAILFAVGKPCTIKRLAELTNASADEVKAALTRMSEALDQAESGIMLQQNGHEVEFVTRAEVADVIKQVIKTEQQGELTRASLEALTILAYRGPLTRPELEQIRGVQSSLILRNLMLRGLVEEKEDVRLGQPTYAVTFDFLNHLGLASVDSLPDYAELRGHTAVNDVLSQLESLSPTVDSQLSP
jgi:segregation and condensation protein B